MTRKREIASFQDYTGGLNDTVAPDRMKANELEQVDNIDLSVRGGFGYRYGTTNINETSYELDVKYIIEYPLKNGDLIELSVMSDKKLYETTHGTLREIALLNDYNIDHVIYRNAIYLVDGNDFYTYGSFDYTTASGTVDIEVGDIVYNFPKSTNISGGEEGHYYKAIEDISQIDLLDANFENATAWVDVTHSEFEIPDVLRSVKNSSQTDSNIEGIRKCRLLELHPKSHRLFAGGNPNDESALYFSESGLMNYFKVTNILYPTGGEGGMKAIVPIMESILVAYTYGWWEYSGIDETEWKWIKLPIPHGAVNNKCIELTPASFTFLSHNGIWKVSIGILNANIVVSSEDTLLYNISDGRVEKIINSIGNMKHVKSVFANSKYYLAYSENDGELCDKVLVYDFRLNNFVRYTDLKIFTFTRKLDGRVYFGSKNYTMVFDKNYKNDVNENGEVVPIKLNVKTCRFNFDSPFNVKLFHRFFISTNQGVDIGNTFNMWLKIDYANSRPYILDLNNESLIWGYSEWGKVWGLADIASQELGLRRKGVRVQVIFNGEMINTLNSVVVYGVGFDVEYLRAKARLMDFKKLIDADYNMID